MKRALFNFTAAVSLLLCIALGVLWLRSGPYDERIQAYYATWPREDEVYSYYFAAASYAGTFSFRFNRDHFGPPFFIGMSAEEIKRKRQEDYIPALRWQFVGPNPERYFLSEGPRPGFWAKHWHSSPAAGHSDDDWSFAVRDWLPMALLLVLPAVWMNRFRKTRRARRLGLCPRCGYDLRATPERCPECGTSAPVTT